jgi:4-hydroxy-tetrahydrodipicolinate synthase
MLYQAEFPEGFRAAVKLRGFSMGRGRQPLSEKQLSDIGMLSRTLQCLLSAHGFTDQPVEGCSPQQLRTSSGGSTLPTSDVSRITQAVVAELQRRGLM